MNQGKTFRTLSILGLAVALVPFLGIPGSWKTLLVLILGLVIMIVALGWHRGEVLREFFHIMPEHLRRLRFSRKVNSIPREINITSPHSLQSDSFTGNSPKESHIINRDDANMNVAPSASITSILKAEKEVPPSVSQSVPASLVSSMATAIPTAAVPTAATSPLPTPTPTRLRSDIKSNPTEEPASMAVEVRTTKPRARKKLVVSDVSVAEPIPAAPVKPTQPTSSAIRRMRI